MAGLWHSFSKDHLYTEFATSEEGLTTASAKVLLAQWGENVLPEEKPHGILWLFLTQFQSPLIYILMGASVIVFLLGEMTDSLIIVGILLFNAFVGAFQEGKAQNTLQALKKFIETNATVLRDGTEYVIPDREVVPGDILVLHEGDKIPADARLIETEGLKVDEASLTGESEPVHKVTDVLTDTVLATVDQTNMLFRGTHVVAGHGKAVVVATGVGTVIGGIAKQISSIDTESPLKKDIRVLSRAIIVVVAVISVLLFVGGVLAGNSVKEMFTVVVSLAVSIIPEGLPIVMTLVLATGVLRMSKRHVLVKKLQAVEALGQANVIAVDKTGTVTKNELIVRKVWVHGEEFAVSGTGYEPVGEISSMVGGGESADVQFLSNIAAVSTSAHLYFNEATVSWKITGDPTEAALIVLAQKQGVTKDELLQQWPRALEIPFDYRRKYSAAVHTVNGKGLLCVTGAPEVLFSHCTHVRIEGKDVPATPAMKREWEQVFTRLSAEGLRVLAVAVRAHNVDTLKPEQVHSLSLLGMVAMQDTLRPEVAGAMARAKAAGVRVVMITGDNRITAQAIAKEAGIYKNGDTILTGVDIDNMLDAELVKRLDGVSVFARVTPEHKMRIITAYRKRGDVVAMTGDGVNDAPSLVAADLGISMGSTGTEVAKEASDLVLLNDDFGSIISAIEEGRAIYRSIQRVILYLFSTSAGEVLVIAGGLFLGLPLPLVAAQIIWLNFVTDGFLVLALGMERGEKGLLTEKFVKPGKYLIDSIMLQRMAVMAIPMMVGTLFLFSMYYENDIVKAWTVSLTTLAIFQWFNAWNCRSERVSVFMANPFSNLYLVGATMLVILLQLLAVYNPFLQKILSTSPLQPADWLLITLVALTVIVTEEVRKLLSTIFRKKHD